MQDPEYRLCCINDELHCITPVFIDNLYILCSRSAEIVSHELHALAAALRQTQSHVMVLSAW